MGIPPGERVVLMAATPGGAGGTGSALGWFIVPVPAAGTGAGTFSKSGWIVEQASTAAIQAAWIAAGYLGPYSTQAEAQAHFQAGDYQSPAQVQKQTAAKNSAPPLTLPDPLAAWLKGLGGSIGSGLEAAGVAFLNDLWDVIIGPAEIFLGAVLALFILIFAFKNDMMSIAPVAMAMMV